MALAEREADECQTGNVFDRGRVEWLREVFGRWIDSVAMEGSEES